MKKVLIFDLDGTLADTLDSVLHAINLAAEKFGYSQKTYEEARAAIGNGARKLVQRLMPTEDSQNDERVDSFLRCYNSMYDTTYMEADKCYDGMCETLKELKRRGYVIAILSNKPDVYVRALAEQLIEPDIVSLAHGQREGYPRKPDPTVPLAMLSELGGSPETAAFIGDSDVDILTAKNAGMTSVGCDWGYRGREVLESCGADHIISSPEQLLDIFK